MAEIESKLTKEQKYLASRRKETGKHLEHIAEFRAFSEQMR